MDPDDPDHGIVVQSLNLLLVRDHVIGFTPQVCRQLWSVATRPRSVNGFELEPEFVDQIIADLQESFALWDDVPGIASRWRDMVVALKIKGIQVHDANHAAAALKHGATHVLTLDQKDFERYRRFGLEPISPRDVT